MSDMKGKFIVLEGERKGTEVPLQFNPSNYTVEESNEFGEKKLMGLKGVIHQFTGSKHADLTLELLFDATDDGEDVRKRIEPLLRLGAIDRELHAPPPCRFVWGPFGFDGIVSQIKREFTYFYHDGTPGRVKLTVTLKPYRPPEEVKAALDLHSSDISKERVLAEGDSIFLMAAREYNAPGEWRRIAEANGIDDPLALLPGTRLLLPPGEENE
ncbi:CIS tube protein [Hydrogenimonas sp.]